MAFNLNEWKYVGPVNAAGKPTGEAIVYKPAKYLPPYFTRNGFLCPVPNAKAEGGKYGRSELRELMNGKASYWSLNSGGEMKYVFRQTSNPGRSVTGQIHCQDNNELCKVVHENGTLYVAVDLYGNYPLCNLAIGDLAEINISCKAWQLSVTAKVAGSSHGMTLNAKAKYKDSKGYFKFGIYATSANRGSYAIDVIEWPIIIH